MDSTRVMTSDVAENPPTLQKAVQDKDGRKLSRGSITTGLSSSLTTGRWPRGASYVQRLVSGLRRDLLRCRRRAWLGIGLRVSRERGQRQEAEEDREPQDSFHEDVFRRRLLAPNPETLPS